MGAKESREPRGWLGFCLKKRVNQAIKRAFFSFRSSKVIATLIAGKISPAMKSFSGWGDWSFGLGSTCTSIRR